jgi:hypothetical protein
MSKTTIDYSARRAALCEMTLSRLQREKTWARRNADERGTPAAIDYLGLVSSKVEAMLRTGAAAKPRKPAVAGSMAAAIQSVGARPAKPYAWFTTTEDDYLILFTWRRNQRAISWQHDEDGIPVLDPVATEHDQSWRATPHYSQLLNAINDLGAMHGFEVFTALSTDEMQGVGRAKQTPGLNKLVMNSDGTPTRFKVEFSLQGRWHKMRRCPGQDGDPTEQ